MLTLSFLVFVVRHAQSTQNDKFALSLQHLKERARDEVDCSHADKHQNFHQVDTVIFVGCGQACPKHSK